MRGNRAAGSCRRRAAQGAGCDLPVLSKRGPRGQRLLWPLRRRAQGGRAANPPYLRNYGAAASGVLSNIGARLSAFTSTGKLEGFSLKEMFSETFRHRSPEEIEDYLLVGTNRTTPNILDVSTGWPKPWFFARVFFFVAAVYALFLASMVFFTNPKFIPGFIFMGSLAVPLAVLVLFFELNTPRNVSFYSLLTLVAMGGVLSLITSSIGYQFSVFAWLGAPRPGLSKKPASWRP